LDAHFLPVLTYACETWTLLAADRKRLEAFHMKCQCHIAKIHRQDHVWNIDIFYLSDLGSVLDPIIRRHSSLFGHVARLPEDNLATKARDAA